MSKLESRALEQFQAAGTLINPALQEWEDQGCKAIGCMYHFVPEEMITACIKSLIRYGRIVYA